MKKNNNDTSNKKRIIHIEDILRKNVENMTVKETFLFDEQIKREIQKRIFKGKDELQNERLLFLVYELSQKQIEVYKKIKDVSTSFDFDKIVRESGVEIPVFLTVQSGEVDDPIKRLKKTIKDNLVFSKNVSQGISDRAKNSPFYGIMTVDSYEKVQEAWEEYLSGICFSLIMKDYPKFIEILFDYAYKIAEKVKINGTSTRNDLNFAFLTFNNNNILDSTNKLSRIFEKFIRHYRSQRQFNNALVLNVNKSETLFNHIDYLKKNNLAPSSSLSRMENTVMLARNYTSHELVDDVDRHVFTMLLLSFIELLIIIDEN